MDVKKLSAGGQLAVLGSLLLAIAMGGSSIPTHFGERQCVQNWRVPDEAKNDALYSPQNKVEINGTLCLGINKEAFLKAARTELRKLTIERNEAKTAFEAAQTAKTLAEKAKNAVGLKPEDKSKADGVFKEAENELRNANDSLSAKEAALAKFPIKRSLYLFIDGVQSPAEPFQLRVNDEIDNQSDIKGWDVKLIKLSANSDASSKDGIAWRSILTGPTEAGERPINITFAESDDATSPLSATLSGNRNLVIFKPWCVVVGLLGLLVITIGLITKSWSGSMLRDRAPVISEDPSLNDPSPPFSLSRVQFLWWLFLSISGFLFIWLVTGQFISIVTSGVLTLLGIAGIAGLSARVVDQLPSAPLPAGHNPAAPLQSKGFFTDILSGGTGPQGIGLHRFQLVAWNVILGAIFIWSILNGFVFPAFDQSLLILAGIINATYVGFKLPENK